MGFERISNDSVEAALECLGSSDLVNTSQVSRRLYNRSVQNRIWAKFLETHGSPKCAPEGQFKFSAVLDLHGSEFLTDFDHIFSEKKSDLDLNHTLVLCLISLYHKFNELVCCKYKGDQICQNSVRNFFTRVFAGKNYTSDYRSCLSQILLAKFLDEFVKTKSDFGIDTDAALDAVSGLCGYLRERDVFERYCHIYFKNRLFENNSAAQILRERQALRQLPFEQNFRSKLDILIQEFPISEFLCVEWTASSGYSQINFDMNVSIFSSRWPDVILSSVPKTEVYKNLATGCEQYSSFFVSHEFPKCKKVQWVLNEGNAELKMYLKKNTAITLVVTTYQMLILLLFNDDERLTTDQIAEKTSISIDRLRTHLLSLAHPKHAQILCKTPNTSRLGSSDIFTVNRRFVSGQDLVRVPLLFKNKKLRDELQRTSSVQYHRKLQRENALKKCIFRIMNTRRTMTHLNLVKEVRCQLNFNPSEAEIKKQIERLMVTEYMERNTLDRKVYHYIA